jgi:replication factor C small subunit
MESYTQTCRFILSCNYSSKIIEPLQSRCSVFRFRKVPKEAIKKRLHDILKAEGAEHTEAGLDAVLYLSEGDIRHAINLLQSAAALGKVDEDGVYSIASRARPEDIRTLLSLAVDGKFLDARNLLDRLLMVYGMSGEDVILQMNREAMNLSVDDDTKVGIVSLVGDANFALVEGANERIQLEALLARVMRLKK